jgi:hypothetical protein
MAARHWVTGLAAATLTVATAGAASAAPQQVTCGGTVTGHARLTHDLTCTSGDGVTLTGDATLDLGGHRLAGTATAVGVTASQTGTSTIVGGTLQGWGRAVVAGSPESEGSPVLNVRGVRFVDNASAAIEAFAATVTVDRVRVSGGVSGVDAGFGSSLTVSRSTFRDVRFAVTAFFGELTLTGSSLTGNETAVNCGDSTCDVTGNVLAGNGTALSTFNAVTTVADNDITGNDVGYTTSISSDEVHGNRFTGNGTAAQVGPLGRTVLRENVFVRNGVGFRGPDTAETAQVILDRNTFRRNGDGILVEFPGASLSGNSAIRNTRWGIFAPGAIDLGGNIARGNGNEPQCVGVVCSAR